MAGGRAPKKPRLIKFNSAAAQEEVEYQRHHVYRAQKNGQVTAETAFTITQASSGSKDSDASADPTMSLDTLDNTQLQDIEYSVEADADIDTMENIEGTCSGAPAKKQTASVCAMIHHCI